MRIFIDKNNKVYKREIKDSKKYNYAYSTIPSVLGIIVIRLLTMGG
tara:strand:- start:2675 stop:2812 length:138 start_codon:yes stop_codon:yes gene_type:complete